MAKSCGKTFCHKAPDDKSNENLTRETMKEHLYTSPFVLSERVGVDNFIVINQEDMTPLSENASIESETPRYFQVDNLYRIDAAKSLS